MAHQIFPLRETGVRADQLCAAGRPDPETFHFYEIDGEESWCKVTRRVSMPSRADDSFLPITHSMVRIQTYGVSMPSRADDSFLRCQLLG